jgi:ABC-type nitrate/sulfonate/bicarbonate transport system ATPase subunit
VFSARPGRIKAEFENPLPRPRAIGAPDFNRLVEALWNQLKQESIAAADRTRPAQQDMLLPNE